MDRVLKRVCFTKRAASQAKVQETPADQEEGSQARRRRRRSASRRRPPHGPATGPTSEAGTSKTRGLFNIDWDSVRECKSCKSRAITRRFCSKRTDNQLYRSNSFKFERFIRGNEETSTLGKKISLCDDYSLPVDHLNKKRPNSIAAPSLSEWNVSITNEDKVEILDTYSTPRDSKQYLSYDQEDLEPKCFISPDREYSQPYTTSEDSSEASFDDDFFGHRISVTKTVELNSPDSIAEGIQPQINALSPNRDGGDIKRHPSPYYYADLYRNKSEEHFSSAKYLNEQTSKTQPKQTTQTSKSYNQKSKSHNHHHHHHHHHQQQQQQQQHRKYRKSSSLDNPGADSKSIIIRAKTGQLLSSSVETRSSEESRDAVAKSEDDKRHRKQSGDGSHDVCRSDGGGDDDEGDGIPCVCLTSDGLEDEEMTRQRHVYETAFDCRVNKSDDDLDQIDNISNHPVLIQTRIVQCHPALGPCSTPGNKKNTAPICPEPSQPDNNVEALGQNLQDMHLPANESSTSKISLSLPLRGYTPSPPSTAPLPIKFHGKDSMTMNSIRSAPNLPLPSQSSQTHGRYKDLHLPVKSLRGRSPTSSSGSAFDIEFGHSNRISEFKGRPVAKNTIAVDQDRILEIKDRPRKDLLLFKKHVKDGILEFRGRRRKHKYSSTESMTTSSSGGSMESIKSSTSEGNRSTSSSESRQSSSLSSHSSDGGHNSCYNPGQSGGFLSYSNKLHILSPISDKSSQEPISEVSDNNRNNNSQKCSPEEAKTPENMKTKRRLPQNKNLLNLAFRTGDPEIQGSDSGISIQSREGIKSRFGFTKTELSAPPSQQDFTELPFDMPKLRRRRALPQDACTSGSATSVDLRDLPFDMPKLRRRLRVQQTSIPGPGTVSQASSSQSVIEMNSFRPKLTLNLAEVGTKQRPGLGLSLVGLGLTLDNPEKSVITAEIIDVNLPLEKQGWFHGAITRVEAENVLRMLREGSFLVRNSESTKQDYSLSLKSAKGFMHMRIQKDGIDGCFILGQFSKPFSSIPEMIQHFSVNRLPIRGAEHMCLLQPVIAQLL